MEMKAIRGEWGCHTRVRHFFLLLHFRLGFSFFSYFGVVYIRYLPNPESNAPDEDKLKPYSYLPTLPL